METYEVATPFLDALCVYYKQLFNIRNTILHSRRSVKEKQKSYDEAVAVWKNFLKHQVKIRQLGTEDDEKVIDEFKLKIKQEMECIQSFIKNKFPEYFVVIQPFVNEEMTERESLIQINQELFNMNLLHKEANRKICKLIKVTKEEHTDRVKMEKISNDNLNEMKTELLNAKKDRQAYRLENEILNEQNQKIQLKMERIAKELKEANEKLSLYDAIT